MIRRIARKAALLLTLAIGMTGAAQANLVANGGFESGPNCSSVTSWTGSGAFTTFNGTSCLNSSYVSHSGSASAGFGQVGSLGAISQDLATIAGQSYHLQFFLRSDGGTPSQFVVSADGVSLLNIANTPLTGYVEYNFDFIALDGATTLLFAGRNDPTWWLLDDVSVVATNGVPEPGSLALLGLGLVAVAAARRRRA